MSEIGGLPPLDALDPAAAALQESLDTVDFASVEKEDQKKAPPKISTEFDKNGDLRLKADLALKEAAELIAAAKGYKQIMQGFAQQQFQRAEAIRKDPWAHVATTIAGNLAQAKDLPGWVQGLGRANLELNPQPDELIRRGSAYETEGIRTVEGALGLGDRMLTHQQAVADREEKEAALREYRASRVMGRATEIAAKMQKQFITNPDAYKPLLKSTDMSPEEVDAQAKVWAKEATDAKADKDLQVETKNKLTAEKVRADAAHRQVMETLSARRVQLSEARARLEENVKSGKLMNPLAYQKERRLLITALHDIERGGLKTLIASDKARADIVARYLQNKNLDDADFGTRLDAFGTSISQKASEASQLAAEQKQQLIALIKAGDEAYEAATGSKPPALNLATPETPKPTGKTTAEKAKESLKLQSGGGIRRWDPERGWVDK